MSPAERAAELALAFESEARELEIRAIKLRSRAADILAECMAAADAVDASSAPNKLKKRTVSVAEAAEALGVGEQCLREDIRRGRFPATRVGKRILISRKHLEKVLAEAESRA